MNKFAYGIVLLCILINVQIYGQDQIQNLLETKNIYSSADVIRTPVVSGKYEIPVCASLPLSGEVGIIGQDILDGMQLFINRIKQYQPSLNFFVNLSALDDGADVAKFCENIEILARKTPLFVSSVGTEITKYLINYLKTNNILSFFPVEGSAEIRSSVLDNQIFLRASYRDELNALIKFLVKNLNKKRIAIFYEDSDWGNDALKSAQQILKKFDLSPVAVGSYLPKTINIIDAAKTLTRAKPTAVVCIAQSRPAYFFMRQMLDYGMYKTIFSGLSNLFSIQETLKKSRGITILLSSVVPDPFRSKLVIAKDFRDDMNKFFPNKNISPFIFEGYINMAVLCAIVQDAGFPLTIEKILKSISGLKNFKLASMRGKDEKDLKFKFDPKTRSLLRKRVWINTGGKRRWKLEKDYK